MTMNTVRGSHLLVTVQNMPSALRGEAARDAGLKVRPPCRWECSDPPLTCERKAEDITMPGSPQGRGQTDKPTRNITFKGKERSKAEGNRKSEDRKCPALLHQLAAFCPPKSRLLRLVFFHPPLLFSREFRHSS